MRKINRKNQPFHLFVPQWMIRVIEKRKCSKCDNPLRREYIQAVGVRELKKVNGFVFFVEHCCGECDYVVCTNLTHEKTGNLEDLCYAMIEQMHNNKKIQRAKDVESGKRSDVIQDYEVNECLRFLAKTKTHEDFLKFIGADDIVLDTDED